MGPKASFSVHTITNPMTYPLLSVLWTLTDEPSIMKQALFKPSNPADRKPLIMPVNYWRFEVLKPILGNDIDQFPNAVKNHFCPLFWLSNFFPIWLAGGFVWWVFCLVLGAVGYCFNGIRGLCKNIADGLSEDRRAKKKIRDKDRAKNWLERWLEGPPPEKSEEFLGGLKDYKPKDLEKSHGSVWLNEGEKWDWANPPKAFLEHLENLGRITDFNNKYFPKEYAVTLNLIGFAKRHGQDWKKELKALAAKQRAEQKQNFTKKQEAAKAKAESDKIFNARIARATIWAKRIGTWILWALTIPAVWVACWIAYWLYVFLVWLGPLLVEGGGYIWDAIWDVFAYHTLDILFVLIASAAIWILGVLICNGVGALWRSLKERDEAYHSEPETEAPKWLKAIGSFFGKCFSAIGSTIGLLVDIVRMSYNNNCPAIERATKATESDSEGPLPPPLS